MKTNSPHPPLIAIIEDELPIRKFLRASLTGEGYRITESESLAEGLRNVTQQPPDVILLDLGLPDGDGKTLIRQVRDWTTVPIIVLSARDQESEKVAALDAGADDYLSKPFSVPELLARIRVSLRHHANLTQPSDPHQSAVYQNGELKVDLNARRVFRSGEEMKLTKIEFDLLVAFIRHGGKVLTHRFLLKEVWGPQSVHETHYLRVFVANLRKKLEPEPARPRYLLTEQGVGYRFVESEPLL